MVHTSDSFWFSTLICILILVYVAIVGGVYYRSSVLYPGLGLGKLLVFIVCKLLSLFRYVVCKFLSLLRNLNPRWYDLIILFLCAHFYRFGWFYYSFFNFSSLKIVEYSHVRLIVRLLKFYVYILSFYLRFLMYLCSFNALFWFFFISCYMLASFINCLELIIVYFSLPRSFFLLVINIICIISVYV